MGNGILPHLSELLRRIVETNPSALHATHFVQLEKNSYAKNMEIFLDLVSVLPFSMNDRYQVYLGEDANLQGTLLFQDSMLISCTFDGARRYYWLNFAQDGLSDCMYFEDSYLYEFIKKSYNATIRTDKPLYRAQPLIPAMDEVMTLENAGIYYMIKDTPSFRSVPTKVFRTLVERNNSALFALKEMLAPDVWMEDPADACLQSCENRYKNSFKHANVDVCNIEGMEKFMKTGQLSDEVSLFPSLDKREMKIVLETWRDRTASAKDPYRLLLLKNPPVADLTVMAVSQGSEMLFGYAKAEDRTGMFDHVIIPNRTFSEAFFQYVDKHLVPNYSMSEEETIEYLNTLLSRL
ncbi:MAG: hypothetical protein ACK5LX_08920 [Oscillospiraceae bacterium]